MRGQRGRNLVIELEIDADFNADDKAYIKNRADDALSEWVNHGGIDHLCDSGIENFGVQTVKRATGEPTDFKK